MEDEQQALRDIIGELVTDNATLQSNNARLLEDNQDLAQQAANYLAQITACKLNAFHHHPPNQSPRSSKNGGGENNKPWGDEKEDSTSTIASSSTSTELDEFYQVELQQRTIDELELKVMKLMEEKFEMMTRIELLEHQLMIQGSAPGDLVGEEKTTRSLNVARGFLPGIFFSSSSRVSNNDVDSSALSSSMQDGKRSDTHNGHLHPPVTTTTTTTTTTKDFLSFPRRSLSTEKDRDTHSNTSTNSINDNNRDSWNRPREDSILDMERLHTTSTPHGQFPEQALSKKQQNNRSSLFSGRFSSIYRTGSQEEEEVIKKPDYFGTSARQKKKNSHRLSTAATMVDDSRNIGPASFNLVL